MHDITVPSGATVTIKDPDDLTYGDREDFLSAMQIDLDGKAQGVTGGAVMAQLERGLVVAAVEAWTVQDPKTDAVVPIPSVSAKSLRLIRAGDFAAIAAEARALQQFLFPEDFGPDPDPASPTSPSAA